MTGLYVGQAIGGFGATAAAAFSWQSTFHWFGIVGIAYSVVLIFFLHENPVRMKIEKVVANGISKGNSIGKGLLLLFSNISFWVILFYFAAPSLPGWATKNWLPTLFAENLDIPMSQAGPISTITIALSSFVGVILGGFLSDRWVLKNIRGRVYTGAIGLGMTIPALLLIGFGHGFISVIGAGLLFGIGFGIFDAIWYYEYDRSFCRSCSNSIIGKMDRRWKSGRRICYAQYRRCACIRTTIILFKT